jgi:hypothetical protein
MRIEFLLFCSKVIVPRGGPPSQVLDQRKHPGQAGKGMSGRRRIDEMVSDDAGVI